jgi:SET domain-containing protein
MIDSIEYLNSTVWATLRPSPIHGIGVFAIRDIPKGTRITDHSVHTIGQEKLFKISDEDFLRILPEIRSLILDRTSFQKGQWLVFYSPNVESCLQSFMNHSATPNSDGQTALFDIKAGEEITEDYRDHGKPHLFTRQYRTFM